MLWQTFVIRTLSIILFFLFPCHFAVSVEQAVTNNNINKGKVIYQQGLLSNGKPLNAIGQGGIQLTGKQVTCENCHRRSGMGASEGEIISPAITGKILFNPRETSYKQLSRIRQKGVGVRPAYTEEALRQAITKGIGANGRVLDAFMPRFKMPNDDLDALISYLNILGNKEITGVTEEYIDFAVVITPEVSVDKKEAMLSVMHKYVDVFNSGTRHEERRAEYSPWHKTWHYGAYRKWRLHTWQVTGKPDSWQQQLDLFYKDQPVFALVNGIGTDWRPIHNFCEETELPCLFPTTDIPGDTKSDYYSVYFTKGMALESNLIASHILRYEKESKIRLLQVYKESNIRAAYAAEHIRQNINNNKIEIVDYKLADDSNTHLTVDAKRDSFYMIIWGEFQEIKDDENINKYLNSASRVYLSSRLSNNESISRIAELNNDVFVVNRFCLDEKKSNQIKRFTIWARNKDLTLIDDQVMSNAYFAMTTLGDAVKQMRDNISREYLIERIEHMVDKTLFHSVYPHMSLGPDQRFASKGGYIIQQNKSSDTTEKVEAEWIVP